MSFYTVKVCESFSGLRGGDYHFILEGNKLIHISHYGVISKREYGGVCYDVDLSKIKDKTVIRVASSNQGLFSIVDAFPAEDLAVGWYARRRQELPITI